LTTGFAKAHRAKTATVEITDYAIIKKMLDLLDGTTSFNASVPLGYDGTATISTANQFATKAYADGLAIAGSPDSSTTVKGIGKVSVAPVSPTSPIFVGDNDGRVPTQGENDALVGTSGTPSSSNKYVTNDDTAETGASKVLRLTSGGKVTTSTIDTGTSSGQIVILDGSAKLPAVDGSQLTNIVTVAGSDTTERSQVGGGSVANMVTISCSIPV
jgi:trimeric autotransporter adhesin